MVQGLSSLSCKAGDTHQVDLVPLCIQMSDYGLIFEPGVVNCGAICHISHHPALQELDIISCALLVPHILQHLPELVVYYVGIPTPS